jgi:hypothetical protein
MDTGTLEDTIDGIKFRLIEKLIDNDRIYVKLVSYTTDADKETTFVIYKSNSQGMWRYFTCAKGRTGDCPSKWTDYTTTTVIDFRLQYFVNMYVDTLPLSKHTSGRDYREIDQLPTTDNDDNTIKEFMTNRNKCIDPVFEYIWIITKNTTGTAINKGDITGQLTEKTMSKYSEEIQQQMVKYNNEFTTMLTNNSIYIYDLLRIISKFVKTYFEVYSAPQNMYTFNKNIFSFTNANIQTTSVVNIDTSDTLNNIQCATSDTYSNILYPFSTDINIMKIVISNKSTRAKYDLYYMEYKIINDDTLYKMPLLITHIDTKISIYGMPEKYIKTGIYCNKPWDYKKYAFMNTEKTIITQLCRKDAKENENYIFIGSNYNDMWPFTYKQNIPSNLINFIIY